MRYALRVLGHNGPRRVLLWLAVLPVLVVLAATAIAAGAVAGAAMWAADRLDFAKLRRPD